MNHPRESTVFERAFGNDNILQIRVDTQNSLLLQDIQVSAQWALQFDAAYQAELERNIIKASDFLYDFTNGQFALGNVTIYENYDEWEPSDLWLHSDNNQRPLAVVGGIVNSTTVDLKLTEPISYGPGHIYMGSKWNRYNEPPGDPDINREPLTGTIPISDDWAVAFAHELSHYMLFEWDVYYGLVDDPENPGQKKAVPIDTCTGSAMGNVYYYENTEFIHDPIHWNDKCIDTHAYAQVGERNEWETIQAWYDWAISPTAEISGPVMPAIQLTNVIFEKSPTAKPPLPNQDFQLKYRDGETASDRAHAYIIRDNRVLEQGQPPEGGTEITLTGAQEDDRFCVFDIKNVVSQREAEDGDPDRDTKTRHQFGCKILDQDPGEEYELEMEKDDRWEPVIFVTPITSKTINISVTLPISAPALDLNVRIYPEHKQTTTTTSLVRDGNNYSQTFDLPEFTPSAYVQLWAEEGTPPTETNPRYEAMIGYGTKGAVVPGPASIANGAPIISPNGDFIIVSDRDISLGNGEFVAIQEPYALPKLPENTTNLASVSGYRLIALPQTLITSGAVSLRYLPPPEVQVRATDIEEEIPKLVVYFWNGTAWSPLETTNYREENGYFLASAPLQGVGIYALLREVRSLDEQETYLPLLKR
ncbi:hypothetical protein KFU94_18005 [Chloroflexi bacterium TSY]|nr:hypothetical protein [Chloroflexi bacterium TSY]